MGEYQKSWILTIVCVCGQMWVCLCGCRLGWDMQVVMAKGVLMVAVAIVRRIQLQASQWSYKCST